MIVDITNEVYTNIKTTITSATVLPSYPSGIPTFPLITVEELINTTNENTIDSNGEKYNDITFEVSIFSSSPTKVTEVNTLRGQVDSIMSEQYHMTRGYSGRTPNFLDTNVYKYTLRYSCTVDSNKTIYRR